MTATKVLANQRVSVRVGLASGISSWLTPSLAQIVALSDVSGAINWNSFDLNIKTSDQKDDRTLTDGAGSQSRSPYTNFGGNVQAVLPLVSDAASVYRTAYTLLSTPRVELAVAVRYGPLNSAAPAAADRWTVYHVIVDAPFFGENDVSMFYQVSLVARDDIVQNYIVPPAAPVAITTALLAATGTAAGNSIVFASALYQGWNITKGATWVSSDETKLVQVHPGIFRCIAAGTPTITAKYPGATDSTPATVTIT